MISTLQEGPAYLRNTSGEHAHENVAVNITKKSRCELKLRYCAFYQQFLQTAEKSFKRHALLLGLPSLTAMTHDNDMGHSEVLQQYHSWGCHSCDYHIVGRTSATWYNTAAAS